MVEEACIPAYSALRHFRFVEKFEKEAKAKIGSSVSVSVECWFLLCRDRAFSYYKLSWVIILQFFKEKGSDRLFKIRQWIYSVCLCFVWAFKHWIGERKFKVTKLITKRCNRLIWISCFG